MQTKTWALAWADECVIHGVHESKIVPIVVLVGGVVEGVVLGSKDRPHLWMQGTWLVC